MDIVAWVIERLALRHLVNQEPIILLMATLGIAYLLDGFGPMVFGSEVYSINVGMPKDPVFLMESTFEGGVMISLEDLMAAGIAAVMVAALSISVQLPVIIGNRTVGKTIEGGKPGDIIPDLLIIGMENMCTVFMHVDSLHLLCIYISLNMRTLDDHKH